MSPRTKIVISVFIALNLTTVVFMNVRGWLVPAFRPHVDPTTRGRLEAGGWLLHRYAHAVGLDNRWVMFSSVYRSDWQLRIRARCRNGDAPLLPLPLQGERTAWQRCFADFREAKFHLNIYSDARAKNAYASHLARTYPSWNGAPIDAIAFEIAERPFIRTPEEASTRGTHFAGEPRTHLLALCPTREASHR